MTKECNGCEYLHIRKCTASNMCAIWIVKCEAYSDKDGDNWIEFIASKDESIETPDWCGKENKVGTQRIDGLSDDS